MQKFKKGRCVNESRVRKEKSGHFERNDRKPIGDNKHKALDRRDDNKTSLRGDKNRLDKSIRPTPSTTTNKGEARTPKKTTAGSRTRTRKNNNENN